MDELDPWLDGNGNARKLDFPSLRYLFDVRPRVNVITWPIDFKGRGLSQSPGLDGASER